MTWSRCSCKVDPGSLPRKSALGVIRLDNGNARAYNNLGILLSADEVIQVRLQGGPREFTKKGLYLESIRLDNGNARAYNNLGILLSADEVIQVQLQGGPREFTKKGLHLESIRLDNGCALAYYMLGTLLSATRWSRCSCKVDPGSSPWKIYTWSPSGWKTALHLHTSTWALCVGRRGDPGAAARWTQGVYPERSVLGVHQAEQRLCTCIPQPGHSAVGRRGDPGAAARWTQGVYQERSALGVHQAGQRPCTWHTTCWAMRCRPTRWSRCSCKGGPREFTLKESILGVHQAEQRLCTCILHAGHSAVGRQGDPGAAARWTQGVYQERSVLESSGWTRLCKGILHLGHLLSSNEVIQVQLRGGPREFTKKGLFLESIRLNNGFARAYITWALCCRPTRWSGAAARWTQGSLPRKICTWSPSGWTTAMHMHTTTGHSAVGRRGDPGAAARWPREFTKKDLYLESIRLDNGFAIAYTNLGTLLSASEVIQVQLQVGFESLPSRSSYHGVPDPSWIWECSSKTQMMHRICFWWLKINPWLQRKVAIKDFQRETAKIGLLIQ